MKRDGASDDLVREAEAREGDLALLRDLMKETFRCGDERDAVEDMLRRMERGRIVVLSVKQRTFAESVATRFGVHFEDRHRIRAADVPRGREAPTPNVLSPDSLKAALAARRKDL